MSVEPADFAAWTRKTLIQMVLAMPVITVRVIGSYDIDEDGFCDGEDTCPWVSNPEQNDDVCANGIQMFADFDTFEGSWYEIGRQIGQTYPDSIIDFANTFTIVLEVLGPLGWTSAELLRCN